MAGRKQRTVKAHAHLRQSQLLRGYGPGAMVDLPKQAVIIGGLESWGNPRTDSGFAEVQEERLRARLALVLDVPDLMLFAPPPENVGPGQQPRFVTAFEFPKWFVAQYDRHGEGGRARPLVPHRQLVKRKYQDDNKKTWPVQPIRFVQACVQGHVSDVDWVAFAHHGDRSCRRDLWLLERGTSGDFLDLFVECDCGKFKPRPIYDAIRVGEGGSALGFCKGERPWLGKSEREECRSEENKPRANRLLVRTASNAYFSQLVSAISIPDLQQPIRGAVAHVYAEFLQQCDSAQEVAYERKKPRVAEALKGFDDGVVWEEVQRRKQGLVAEPLKGLKEAELETLTSKGPWIGEDGSDSHFFAEVLEQPRDSSLERVVLLHRLREVAVQVGFTRFEAVARDVDGELDLDVQSAKLALNTTWLPAVENHGEGLFVGLRPEAVQSWLGRAEVKKYGKTWVDAFEAWKQRKHVGGEFPGPEYVLLHSLSHLIINAVAVECGYSASAIRERIYASPSGYGILLFTGSSDAEGTLGGLIEVGRRFPSVLDHAKGLGGLCSNDPVCAQHSPDELFEERFAHGAACHGCLLIPEPSCERQNELLDRSLVVETLMGRGAAFFPDKT